MKKKIAATIEARMGSTRFPGKVLKKLGAYPVLEYMVRRLKRSRMIEEICIATADSQKDSVIVELAKKIGSKYYTGSEEDVVNRVYGAAVSIDAGIIVAATGDCPMIDAGLIDEALDIYLRSDYDCVGVGMNNNYPHGLDFYIINMRLLEEMDKKANTPYQREHLIEYVTSQPEKFDIHYLVAPPGLKRPDVRITVDYPADLQIMNAIISRIGEDDFDYSIADIIASWDSINVRDKAVL